MVQPTDHCGIPPSPHKTPQRFETLQDVITETTQNNNIWINHPNGLQLLVSVRLSTLPAQALPYCHHGLMSLRTPALWIPTTDKCRQKTLSVAVIIINVTHMMPSNTIWLLSADIKVSPYLTESIFCLRAYRVPFRSWTKTTTSRTYWLRRCCLDYSTFLSSTAQTFIRPTLPDCRGGLLLVGTDLLPGLSNFNTSWTVVQSR